jgi:hypothetical protein
MCAHELYFHTYRQYKCLQCANCHKYSIIITRIDVFIRLSDSHKSNTTEGSIIHRKLIREAQV